MPDHVALNGSGVVRPTGLGDPLPEVVRDYIIALETALAAALARAWTVAVELRYEADNRADDTFTALADVLDPRDESS